MKGPFDRIVRILFLGFLHFQWVSRELISGGFFRLHWEQVFTGLPGVFKAMGAFRAFGVLPLRCH